MRQLTLYVWGVVALLISPFSLWAQAPPEPDDWLLAQQQADGGWSDGFSARSGAGVTVDVLLALNAADIDWEALDPSLVAYLVEFTNRSLGDVSIGLAAKLTLAAVVSDTNPRDFGGVDLIDLLLSSNLDDVPTDADNAAPILGETFYEHCLATVALGNVEALSQELDLIPPLIAAQNENGGWGLTQHADSDTNTTAMCIQAILAQDSPSSNTTLALAWDYLRSAQQADGGWGFGAQAFIQPQSDAYSTASVIMALNAAGEDLGTWQNADDALRGFATADGSFSYLPENPTQNPNQVAITAWSMIALEGDSLVKLSD